MLAKQHRLTVADFKQLPRTGKHFHRTLVHIQWVPSPTKKVAIIVSKKVSKKAVVRNKIRRMLYGVVESRWEMLVDGWYIIRVKPTARQATLRMIRSEAYETLGSLVETR